MGLKHEDRLIQVDPTLASIVREASEIMDIAVTEGFRSKETQNAYFNQGLSKVPYPKSKHNDRPARAVDVVPLPVDWQDTKRFFFLAGIMKTVAVSHKVKLRWGGDWDGDNDFNDQDFNDLVHFELVD